MKPKSISRFQGLRHSSTLAIVTTLTAFAAGSAFAVDYQWRGTTNSIWGTSTNWSTAVAPTGTVSTPLSASHRLNINNGAANEAIYTAAFGTTTYANTPGRGLVIGSGALGNGTLRITGGKFSTAGSGANDIIGNVTPNSGTLIVDGGEYETSRQLDCGIGFGTNSTLTINSGTATVTEISTNNSTATFNLNGGTLAMNRLAYSGGGNNNINFNGGTLKSRTASTTFIGTPSNGNTTITVRSGGAIIDADHNITITRPLLGDTLSTGGGITKNGTGNLTLGAVSTTTGAAIVNAGGLSVSAGLASWKPSSLTHSGNAMNFNLGVYNASNLACIDTAGALTLNSAITVNVSGSQFIIGQIPLIKYGSKTGAGALTLNTASLPPGVVATLQDNGVGLIYLDVTQGGFVWSGASLTPGTGDWDTSSSNWNNFLATYVSPAPVIFPTISGGGTVTIPADVTPTAVDFTNTTGNDYVITGAGKITGSAVVNKTGNGRVTLNNSNTYTGNTNITSGILSIATTDSLPGWNANSRYPVASGATLAVQNTVSDGSVATMLGTTGNFGTGAILGFDTEAADRTYASNLTGAIGVANVGTNILTISGNNSHTGTTLVALGSLKAGSSTAFTGTGPLVMNPSTSFDLGGFNASFTTINGGALSNTISNESAGTGISTLSLIGGGSSFLGAITDGPTRKVALRCRATNASNVPNNFDNTYSGGLTLLGGIDAATNGIRLNPYASFTTIDSGTGLVTSGPYGTGSIFVGETATDRVQVYFNAPGRTIANNVVVNTALGTDTVGGFRIENTGNVISGGIIANEASAFFRNNVTGGSAGNGEITLSGPISTGNNPAAGLTVTAAGVNSLVVTLNNQTASANSYTGNTSINGVFGSLILGTANQIPNGAGKGNVTMASSKLDLAGFNETINGLSGSGTVDNFTTGTANTLTLGDGDATGSFSGTIANTNGELSLTKIGSGIQTLSGLNAYTGTTVVRDGTINILGSLDSPTVTVGGAGATGSPTLTGAGGTVSGTLLIAAAGGGAEGAIDPGTAGTTGILNVSNTTINGRLACDVISATTDVLNVGGNLDITGAKFTLNAVTPTPGTYTIATYSGTLTGTFTPVPALPSGSSIDYNTPNEIKLIIGGASGYGSWVTANSVTEGENGDDDKDGISNLVEYALGLDPKTGNSTPGTFIGNTLLFSKGTEAKAALDLSYFIETSTTLAPGSWSQAAATDTTDNISFLLPPNQPGGKIFGRLKVTKP